MNESEMNPKADEPLSVEDVIRAMLNGETLYAKDDKGDMECWYYHAGKCFLYAFPGNRLGRILSTFPDNFYRRPVKHKRDMTRWEALAWASSEASRGWVVRINISERWHLPQFFSYDSDADKYQRARLLPDGSGIDEDSICWFEVEE
jgi:hypothetical protein